MAESGGRIRARNLLSSYYGVQEEAGGTSAVSADEDEMNIDSNAFAVDKYVGTLLQYKSLEELVQRGNAMVSEIKSLDSDMQMLVYENYNKFISATDTIRKMKQRVEVCASTTQPGELGLLSLDARGAARRQRGARAKSGRRGGGRPGRRRRPSRQRRRRSSVAGPRPSARASV